MWMLTRARLRAFALGFRGIAASSLRRVCGHFCRPGAQLPQIISREIGPHQAAPEQVDETADDCVGVGVDLASEAVDLLAEGVAHGVAAASTGSNCNALHSTHRTNDPGRNVLNPSVSTCSSTRAGGNRGHDRLQDGQRGGLAASIGSRGLSGIVASLYGLHFKFDEPRAVFSLAVNGLVAFGAAPDLAMLVLDCFSDQGPRLPFPLVADHLRNRQPMQHALPEPEFVAVFTWHPSLLCGWRRELRRSSRCGASPETSRSLC